MNNNNFNVLGNLSSNSVGGQLISIFLTMIAVALLLAGLVYIIHIAQRCVTTRTGYYEPFESPPKLSIPDDYAKKLQEQIAQIRQLNAELDNSIDVFSENIQNSCEVYSQVEDMFVENSGTPQSDIEYQLPKENLNKLLERRRAGAKKQFAESRTIYGQSRGAPVYECFSNPTPPVSIPDLENTLRMELTTLATKMNNAQCGDVGKKYESIESLLSFNETKIPQGNKQNKQIVEGYASPNNNASVGCKVDTKEQEADERITKTKNEIQALSGIDLLNRGQVEIRRARQIIDMIQKQQSSVSKQVELVEQLKKSAHEINQSM